MPIAFVAYDYIFLPLVFDAQLFVHVERFPVRMEAPAIKTGASPTHKGGAHHEKQRV